MRRRSALISLSHRLLFPLLLHFTNSNLQFPITSQVIITNTLFGSASASASSSSSVMGCSTSRIDQLPAVTLCHDRCKFLEEALQQSYALADAHLSYMHSLKSLGHALHRFFHQNQITTNTNINPETSSSNSADSSSDSHIDFRSDSEEENEGKEEKDSDLIPIIHSNHFNQQALTVVPSESFSFYANNSENSDWKTPPPPAPSSSPWDFLNFFDSYDRYEMPIIRNKEDDGKTQLGNEKQGKTGEEKQGRKKVAAKSDDAEKKDGIFEKGKTKEKKDSAEARNQCFVAEEVMKEVEVMFEKAAESGNEVLKILDTGRFRYYHKKSVYQGVSSTKMLRTINPLFFDSPEKKASVHVGLNEELSMDSVNLSSTLKKLCLWERKLYDEVKAEEKLRIVYAKNYRQMRSLKEKGMDNNKIELAQNLMITLSTKIKVAIRVIQKMSKRINKLRDEELWPQMIDLIKKLFGMWKSMVECHKCQSQAIAEAKSLDHNISSNGHFSDDHLIAAMQLKIALQTWKLSFSDWIGAQRWYVKALNGWLQRYLPSQPQAMMDDVVSPRLSLAKTREPLVFALCRHWSNAVDKVSELEAIDAINGICVSVNVHLERHCVYLQQRLNADKDVERKVRSLEKMMLGPKKRRFLAAGNELTNNGSLYLGLKQIFLAIESFSINSMQVYEELEIVLC